MARTPRRNRAPAQRRSVSAPIAGKPKSQSGGEPVERRRGVRAAFGYLGEVRGELAKVDFPNRHQTLQSTGVVIATCVLVGIYLYGLDQVFVRLVQRLIDLQK
jgi:preprotein translocase SecE subunit